MCAQNRGFLYSSQCLICYLLTEETFYEMIVVQNVLYEEVTDKL